MRASLGIEVKVGAFTLASVAVLIAFVFILGDFDLRPGVEIQVDYAYSGGVQPGAPVRISGIGIGKVKEVDYIGDRADLRPPAAPSLPGQAPPQIRLRLSLQPRYAAALGPGARFFVSRAGLFGEPYVEVVEARAAPPAPPGTGLRDGVVLRGMDAPRTELLLAELGGLVEGLRGLLGGERWPELAQALQQGGALAAALEETLVANRQQLAAMASSGAAAAADARQVAANLADLTGPGGDLRLTLAHTRQLTGGLAGQTEQLAAGLAQARSTLAAGERMVAAIDPRLLARGSSRAADALEELALAAEDLHAVTSNLRAGQGTAGGLLANPEIYHELRSLAADLRANPWKVLWRQ